MVGEIPQNRVLPILKVHFCDRLAGGIAGCCFPVFTLISPKVNGSKAFVVFSFIIAILLLVTHRKNIKRLREGTESKIHIWKTRRTRTDGPTPPKNDGATPRE